MIAFELDGAPAEAAPGETIFQVAQRMGTTLPHLCYSPAPGYRSDGNCRACMVEIEGERVLAPSCLRIPTAGMKVRTATERATKARRMVMELLLADQPPRDVSPDPTSKLHAWADAIGVTHSPQPTQVLSPIGSSLSNTIFPASPRYAMPITSLTWTSRHARTHRPH